MVNVIAVRSETKSRWERRTPLTPAAVRRLVKDRGFEVIVQPSARRVFHDKEFVRAGATLSSDLSPAGVVLGVKEIPPDLLQPGTAYMFFSHVIKGQSYNMPMLARLMELGCTLIDYEAVTDEGGRRLIFFGRFAGLAGMIDSLWALGKRWACEGISTPLAGIDTAHEYESLDEAKHSIREAGKMISRNGLPEAVAPVIVGITGYGNVASGVREILAELPTVQLDPAEVEGVARSGDPARDRIYQVTYAEEDVVAPQDPGHRFGLQDYYDHPEVYEARFSAHLPHLTLLMNCNYWDRRYPRLVTREDVRRLFCADNPPRLRVIGDLSCDIEGSVECTLECTDPGNPVYVYDPETRTIAHGVEGNGPVILAVDILPSELPRDASEAFSETLASFVPALARADFGRPFEALDLPAELLRSVIVHRGELTPSYRYLKAHLRG